MFIHHFKYSLKTLLRSKMLIFWTFAFPIILGTFFNMAFSDIEKNEQLDIIDIAIVNNDSFKNNTLFKESFKKLGDKKREEQLFNIHYTTEKRAKKLLADKKVTGYLIFQDATPTVVVSTNGINETIFKSITEEVSQNAKMVENVAADEIKQQAMIGQYNIDYESIYKDSIKQVTNQEVVLKDVSNNNLSYTMIEFYTLIAMTCLYGGLLGMIAINSTLANMSNNGKRVSVSPIKKSTLILGSLLASYLIQLIGLALLFIYTIFVLKVDYGNNLFLVLLLASIGALAGLSLGLSTATLIKSNDNIKTGIIISITMLCCFFSGMMGITMKYIIDKNIPIINKLNPASMITDGLYSLYYYDTLDRYFFNIVSLLIFALIMFILSLVSLRRQKYDSI